MKNPMLLPFKKTAEDIYWEALFIVSCSCFCRYVAVTRPLFPEKRRLKVIHLSIYSLQQILTYLCYFSPNTPIPFCPFMSQALIVKNHSRHWTEINLRSPISGCGINNADQSQCFKQETKTFPFGEIKRRRRK